MKPIEISELINVTGGAGGTPGARPNPSLGKPIKGGISQQELFDAMMDPIRNVGPMMRKHPGLPVSQQTLDAVRNMGVPSTLGH